jgi:CRISPR/Cas system-associated exonuclease Cas4 (RecB family)
MTDLREPILGRFPESVSISNSEIQTYKDCRRKWWLGTYRGLAKKEKEYTGPLKLGTRIHDALEQYYVTGEHPMTAYGKLQRLDDQRFLQSDKATDVGEIKKFNSEAELGRIMMEGYVEWQNEENRDSELEVVAAEKKLSYRLPEIARGRVELIGKVDLQVRRRSDGSRATLDHKSAVTFNPYYEFSHMSEQLMHYTMLETLNPDEDSTPVDGGIYNLLKKVKRTAAAKPPFYERIDVRFNKKTLNSFWTRTQGTVHGIMELRDALDNGADPLFVAYPRPRMDWGCSKCPFFTVCPMIDDGSYAEDYIEDFYEQVDPNARYLPEDGNDE